MRQNSVMVTHARSVIGMSSPSTGYAPRAFSIGDDVTVSILRAEGDRCPICGHAGVPILFGRPAPEASEAAREHQLVLAGCLTRGDGSDPQWQCEKQASHRWTSGEPASPLWRRALTQAIVGRPHCQQCGRPTTLLVYRQAADIFAPDLADGRATLTDEPAPPGVNAQYRCLDCGRVWQ